MDMFGGGIYNGYVRKGGGGYIMDMFGRGGGGV